MSAVADAAAGSAVQARGAAPTALTPAERLELLFDPGSFRPVRSGVRSAALGSRARDGDGVLAGFGRVAGRTVAAYAQDGAWLGGSLGATHAETVLRMLELAGRARAPVVSFVVSGGARVHEGAAALDGYARIFRSVVALTGVVPQISVVCGASAGGAAYAPALTDWVVMARQASMFLTGPGVVRQVLGEDVDAVALGGPRVQGANGVAHFMALDEPEAVRLARSVLGHVAGWGAPAAPPAVGDPGAAVPADPRSVYDVRDALAGILDRGSALEWAPRWARSVVCALARIEGRGVGVVASQPRHLGGVLDVESSQKAAAFVSRCDAAGLPLLVVVDTPGFMPGTRQEQGGVIRHGATLLRAFAAARVPKLTVITRKAYGGAYITLNSKGLGADLVLAWPTAEIGVMGARPAVELIHRREPPEARAALAAAYAADHLSAAAAARDGWVDEVIEPVETRDRVAWALEALAR
jgi:acetyl-CoA carboxylase carboxyltransferase component